MQCEVCGRSARQTKNVMIDGTEYITCPDCSRHGSEPKIAEEAGPRQMHRSALVPRPRAFEDINLVNGYGQLIRNKRQELGLTLEELARKLYEKESIIQKLENEKITPEKKMIEKLERALGLRLREEYKEVRIEPTEKGEGMTLGDFITKKG